MTIPDRPLTFIVRLFPVAADRVRGVVEMVRTGRKYEVRGAEDVARVIAEALAGYAEAGSRSGQHGSLQRTQEGDRRGDDEQPGAMLSSVSSAARIPAMHPLQPMRALVDQTLRELSPAFTRLDARTGRPSIPPEPLLRALLLQLLYSMRGERLFMEQLEYNLLFRWFVGLSMDDPVMSSGTKTLSVSDIDTASGDAPQESQVIPSIRFDVPAGRAVGVSELR
jgi:hypothetical protein